MENLEKLKHKNFLEKLISIFGLLRENIIIKDYILTSDNFLKCLLVMMRVRSKIPVILMGETGCGKTSLIKFLARDLLGVSLEIINFHAGITNEQIIQKIEEISKKAQDIKDRH